MTRPRRLLPTGLLLVVAVLLSGCGGDETPTPLPTEAAPPQAAELGWTERLPQTGDALVFRVYRFAVTKNGWEADVEVENRTDIPWRLPGAVDAVPTSFGVMLFRTDDLDEVERRSADGDLPGLRAASTYTPRLPAAARAGRALARDDRRSRVARRRALRPLRARPLRRGRRSAGGDGARLLVDHGSRAPAESLRGNGPGYMLARTPNDAGGEA